MLTQAVYFAYIDSVGVTGIWDLKIYHCDKVLWCRSGNDVKVNPSLAKSALFQLKEVYCEKICSVSWSYIGPYGSGSIPSFEQSSSRSKALNSAISAVFEPDFPYRPNDKSLSRPTLTVWIRVTPAEFVNSKYTRSCKFAGISCIQSTRPNQEFQNIFLDRVIVFTT